MKIGAFFFMRVKAAPGRLLSLQGKKKAAAMMNAGKIGS